MNETNLILKSYASKLNIYLLNDTHEILYQKGDVISLYSGQTQDLRFIAIDHFNQKTNSLDFVSLQLKIDDLHFSIEKSKTMFLKSNATLLSFSIICDSDYISNKTLEIQISLLNAEENIFLASFSADPIIFKIIPCDIGQIIIEKVCKT